VRARRLLHRSIAVLCHNGAGEVFVHRRTDTKDVFPAMYDMFVAGMVLTGESYAQAAERELHEELGIQGVEPRFLFKHLYRGRDNPNWSAVFEITWDRGIAPLRDEIAWGAFMARDELARRLDQWPFVPDGLEIYRRYLKTQT
jgi:8-oxo-dGTP pyrophosphatase MutT (NUDIX family)